jgi:hypothetical protein
MKWNVSYEYISPSSAGPYRGRQIVESVDKPEKGQTFYAMFGWARIKTVSKVKTAAS